MHLHSYPLIQYRLYIYTHWSVPSSTAVWGLPGQLQTHQSQPQLLTHFLTYQSRQFIIHSLALLLHQSVSRSSALMSLYGQYHAVALLLVDFYVCSCTCVLFILSTSDMFSLPEPAGGDVSFITYSSCYSTCTCVSDSVLTFNMRHWHLFSHPFWCCTLCRRRTRPIIKLCLVTGTLRLA